MTSSCRSQGEFDFWCWLFICGTALTESRCGSRLCWSLRVLGRTIFVVFCSPQDLRFCSAQPGLCHICHSFPHSCPRRSWTHAAGDPVSASLSCLRKLSRLRGGIKELKELKFRGFRGAASPSGGLQQQLPGSAPTEAWGRGAEAEPKGATRQIPHTLPCFLLPPTAPRLLPDVAAA